MLKATIFEYRKKDQHLPWGVCKSREASVIDGLLLCSADGKDSRS